MLLAVSSTRNTSLPYSNFLPLIFKEFNVPTDNEETLTSGPSTIDVKSLLKLDIVKTVNGISKFTRDLTHDEMASIPNLKLKGSHTASSSSSYNKDLEDTIKAMKLDADETREKVIELVHRNNYVTEQVTYLIDKVEYVQEILIKFYQKKFPGRTTDVPESSRKHNSPVSADVPTCSKKRNEPTDSESPELVDASVWEHAAKLKDNEDTNASLLISLAQAAEKENEERNNVDADEQQVIANQDTEEKVTAQTEKINEEQDMNDDDEAPDDALVATDEDPVVPDATTDQPASADAQATDADLSSVPLQTN